MKCETDRQRIHTPATAPSSPRRGAFGGLLVRKEVWRLTGRARILLFLAIIGSGWAATVCVYPFLAVTDEAHGKIVIVEGWVPKHALGDAVLLCNSVGYQRVFTSGCLAVEDLDGLPDQNYAEYAAGRLVRMGLTNTVQAIPCLTWERDRTYNSALAVRDWMKKHDIRATSVDVVTVGPHARRSRLLFEKAFGDGVEINIIALPPNEYDPAHWWRSSEGFRDIIGEAIAYFYARFLFHPPAS